MFFEKKLKMHGVLLVALFVARGSCINSVSELYEQHELHEFEWYSNYVEMDVCNPISEAIGNSVVNSTAQCKMACDVNRACKSFAFDSAEKKCYIFSRVMDDCKKENNAWGQFVVSFTECNYKPLEFSASFTRNHHDDHMLTRYGIESYSNGHGIYLWRQTPSPASNLFGFDEDCGSYWRITSAPQEFTTSDNNPALRVDMKYAVQHGEHKWMEYCGSHTDFRFEPSQGICSDGPGQNTVKLTGPTTMQVERCPGVISNAPATFTCMKRATRDRASVQESCVSCPVGTYGLKQGAAGPESCLLCVPGKYSESLGAKTPGTCLDCGQGKFSEKFAGIFSKSCTSCPAGKFSELTGAHTKNLCVDCLPGTYSETTGLIYARDCDKCTFGKYSEESGLSRESDCNNCGRGRFSPLNGSTTSEVCLDCPMGLYNSFDAAKYCEGKCPPGTYLPDVGGSSASDCIACAKGFYNRKSASVSISDCLRCIPGFYTEQPASKNHTFCLGCPASTYLPPSDIGNGLSSCRQCGNHQSSPVASRAYSQCRCDVGFYREYAPGRGYIGDFKDCSVCRAGYFCPGSSEVQECPLGTWSPAGATSAASCACGTSAENTHPVPLTGQILLTDFPGRLFAVSLDVDRVYHTGAEGVVNDAIAVVESFSSLEFRVRDPERWSAWVRYAYFSDLFMKRCQATFPPLPTEATFSTSNYLEPCWTTGTVAGLLRYGYVLQVLLQRTQIMTGVASTPIHRYIFVYSANDADSSTMFRFFATFPEDVDDVLTPGTYLSFQGPLTPCITCPAGTFIGADAKSCPQCPADFFCVDGRTRTACPTNSFSLSGSASIHECFCMDGFKRSTAPNGDVQCIKCSEGAVSSFECFTDRKTLLLNFSFAGAPDTRFKGQLPAIFEHGNQLFLQHLPDNDNTKLSGSTFVKFSGLFRVQSGQDVTGAAAFQATMDDFRRGVAGFINHEIQVGRMRVFFNASIDTENMALRSDCVAADATYYLRLKIRTIALDFISTLVSTCVCEADSASCAPECLRVLVSFTPILGQFKIFISVQMDLHDLVTKSVAGRWLAKNNNWLLDLLSGLNTDAFCDQESHWDFYTMGGHVVQAEDSSDYASIEYVESMTRFNFDISRPCSETSTDTILCRAEEHCYILQTSLGPMALRTADSDSFKIYPVSSDVKTSCPPMTLNSTVIQRTRFHAITPKHLPVTDSSTSACFHDLIFNFRGTDDAPLASVTELFENSMTSHGHVLEIYTQKVVHGVSFSIDGVYNDILAHKEPISSDLRAVYSAKGLQVPFLETATLTKTIIRCGPNQVPDPATGMNTCRCQFGFVPVDNGLVDILTCEKCSDGFYYFDEKCTMCESGNYCNATHSVSCGKNAESLPMTVNASGCFCKAQFRRREGVCVPCENVDDAPECRASGYEILLALNTGQTRETVTDYETWTRMRARTFLEDALAQDLTFFEPKITDTGFWTAWEISIKQSNLSSIDLDNLKQKVSGKIFVDIHNFNIRKFGLTYVQYAVKVRLSSPHTAVRRLLDNIANHSHVSHSSTPAPFNGSRLTPSGPNISLQVINVVSMWRDRWEVGSEDVSIAIHLSDSEAIISGVSEESEFQDLLHSFQLEGAAVLQTNLTVNYKLRLESRILQGANVQRSALESILSPHSLTFLNTFIEFKSRVTNFSKLNDVYRGINPPALDHAFKTLYGVDGTELFKPSASLHLPVKKCGENQIIQQDIGLKCVCKSGYAGTPSRGDNCVFCEQGKVADEQNRFCRTCKSDHECVENTEIPCPAGMTAFPGSICKCGSGFKRNKFDECVECTADDDICGEIVMLSQIFLSLPHIPSPVATTARLADTALISNLNSTFSFAEAQSCNYYYNLSFTVLTDKPPNAIPAHDQIQSSLNTFLNIPLSSETLVGNDRVTMVFQANITFELKHNVHANFIEDHVKAHFSMIDQFSSERISFSIIKKDTQNGNKFLLVFQENISEYYRLGTWNQQIDATLQALNALDWTDSLPLKASTSSAIATRVLCSVQFKIYQMILGQSATHVVLRKAFNNRIQDFTQQSFEFCLQFSAYKTSLPVFSELALSNTYTDTKTFSSEETFTVTKVQTNTTERVQCEHFRDDDGSCRCLDGYRLVGEINCELCEAGYFSLASHNEPRSCRLCDINHYCRGGNDYKACPQNSFSIEGSSALSDCWCKHNFTTHKNDAGIFICEYCTGYPVGCDNNAFILSEVQFSVTNIAYFDFFESLSGITKLLDFKKEIVNSLNQATQQIDPGSYADFEDGYVTTVLRLEQALASPGVPSVTPFFKTGNTFYEIPHTKKLRCQFQNNFYSGKVLRQQISESLRVVAGASATSVVVSAFASSNFRFFLDVELTIQNNTRVEAEQIENRTRSVLSAYTGCLSSLSVSESLQQISPVKKFQFAQRLCFDFFENVKRSGVTQSILSESVTCMVSKTTLSIKFKNSPEVTLGQVKSMILSPDSPLRDVFAPKSMNILPDVAVKQSVVKCPLKSILVGFECKCEPGRYKTESNLCEVCGSQYFCPGDNTQQPCPQAVSYDTGVKTMISQCHCSPGYYKSGDICQECEIGFFCVGGLGARQSCNSSHPVSPVRTTSMDMCISISSKAPSNTPDTKNTLDFVFTVPPETKVSSTDLLDTFSTQFDGAQVEVQSVKQDIRVKFPLIEGSVVSWDQDDTRFLQNRIVSEFSDNSIKIEEVSFELEINFATNISTVEYLDAIEILDLTESDSLSSNTRRRLLATGDEEDISCIPSSPTDENYKVCDFSVKFDNGTIDYDTKMASLPDGVAVEIVATTSVDNKNVEVDKIDMSKDIAALLESTLTSNANSLTGNDIVLGQAVIVTEDPQFFVQVYDSGDDGIGDDVDILQTYITSLNASLTSVTTGVVKIPPPTPPIVDIDAILCNKQENCTKTPYKRTISIPLLYFQIFYVSYLVTCLLVLVTLSFVTYLSLQKPQKKSKLF